MEPRVTAILTNEQGWQKRISLDEGIHWIGTAANCTIRLPEGESIAPYHVQIVNNAHEAHVRLVNLSSQGLILESSAGDEILAPHGMQDVFETEILHLGSYGLQFDIHKEYVAQQVAREQNQHILGLRLVLSGHVLQPGAVIHGRLYLRNLGDQSCQFEVELDGLPAENYEIDPPPLIHPGGEESSDIRIYHRLISPPAGNLLLTLRVSAPAVYPGRELMVQQVLKVVPNYQFLAAWEGDALPPDPLDRLSFNLPEAVVDAPLAAAQPPAGPAGAPSARTDAPPTPPESAGQPSTEGQEDGFRPAIPLPAHGQKRPDLSGVRVVQGSKGDFLDEIGRQS